MKFARRWILVLGLLLVPMGVLALLRLVPGIDKRFYSADSHLVVVSAIAACALIVASMAAVAASRVPQPGVVWLGLGCTAVGVFMLGHGLVTPGVLGQPHESLGRPACPTPRSASFALCLHIGGMRADRGINRWVVSASGVHVVGADRRGDRVRRRTRGQPSPVQRRGAVRERERLCSPSCRRWSWSSSSA